MDANPVADPLARFSALGACLFRFAVWRFSSRWVHPPCQGAAHFRRIFSPCVGLLSRFFGKNSARLWAKITVAQFIRWQLLIPAAAIRIVAVRTDSWQNSPN